MKASITCEALQLQSRTTSGNRSLWWSGTTVLDKTTFSHFKWEQRKQINLIVSCIFKTRTHKIKAYNIQGVRLRKRRLNLIESLQKRG